MTMYCLVEWPIYSIWHWIQGIHFIIKHQPYDLGDAGEMLYCLSYSSVMHYVTYYVFLGILLHIEYIWIYKKLIIKCFTSFSSLSNLYPLLPFNGCIYCPFITINYCNFEKWLKTATRFSFILQNSQYYRTPSPITTHVAVLFDFLLFFCSTIDQPLINPNPISPQPHPPQ